VQAQERLGHSDPATTLKHCVRLTTAVRAKAVAALDEVTRAALERAEEEIIEAAQSAAADEGDGDETQIARLTQKVKAVGRGHTGTRSSPAAGEPAVPFLKARPVTGSARGDPESRMNAGRRAIRRPSESEPWPAAHV